MTHAPVDYAAALVARAAAILQRCSEPLAWRWLIRIDTFDCYRDEWEAKGLLCTDAEREPTFLGTPYDLGWPPSSDPVQLRASIEAIAPPSTIP